MYLDFEENKITRPQVILVLGSITFSTTVLQINVANNN